MVAAAVGSTVLAASSALPGCTDGMQRIDDRVQRRLAEASSAVSSEGTPLPVSQPPGAPAPDSRAWTPETRNPPASALRFDPMTSEEAGDVIRRLEGYAARSAEVRQMDLAAAIAQSLRGSRDARFAEEEYLLAALDLLVEEHRWGPRFFNATSATVAGRGNDGLFDTSLRLVNEFGVRQRLPYGGEVSARALARATEDLHRRVAGEGTQSADLLLAASIPLLRGAGDVAQESRLQSHRNIIYAARRYERFRRELLFDITREFLDLVVAQRRIENARRGVESFVGLEAQQDALYRAGRRTPFEAAEAQNNRLEAVSRLNQVQESYRLALDRFKVRIGLPPEEPVEIVPDEFGFVPPRIDLDEAVRLALSNRLDLQTRRDQVRDAERSVEVARNGLLGDLGLRASLGVPTDPRRERSGVRFDPGWSDFEIGLSYDWPLDRDIERAQVRQAEIRAARSQREYERTRDTVAIAARAAVREIDAALFSLDIQERNLQIALRREESIRADPGRATIRQQTDAIDQVLRSRDALDDARRTLELAVLRYLLETDLLRVDPEGGLAPISGMTFSDRTRGAATDDARDAVREGDAGTGSESAGESGPGPRPALPSTDAGGSDAP